MTTTEQTETRESLIEQLATLESDEPPCECYQTDVDEFDASFCEYHRHSSPYNREHNRLEAAIERLTPRQEIEMINRQTARIRAIREELVAELADMKEIA